MGLELLIGRDEEIRRLQQCMDEVNAQLVVLYGRRRVGKTFLINEFFEGRFDFMLTGVYNEKKEVQLRHFAEELSSHLKRDIQVPKDWTEAFGQLQDYLSALPQEEKKVVFFDEMPWLDNKMSDFLPAFEYFWNHYGALTHHLIFIACGSASAWMRKNIDENKGGLFHRKTCSLFLEPFSLQQTEQYLQTRNINWSRYDIAECYMILGGIPFYLSLLTPEKSLHDNIDNLFFRKRAELWDEFYQLYRTLFNGNESYIRIVEALGSRRVGLSRKEIAKKAHIPENGKLSEMLEHLVHSDFVRIGTNFNGKKNDVRYQLRDYYTWFYFKFIKDYHGRDEHFWRNSYQNPSKVSWCGITFEQLCKDHVPQIKQKLGIAGVLSDTFSWQTQEDENHAGAQIDLLIDRMDHVISICEIKYSLNEFVIDKDYDLALHNKIGAFMSTTKTTKTIQLAMITTYGVKKNKYSGQVNAQVRLDDLFQNG